MLRRLSLGQKMLMLSCIVLLSAFTIINVVTLKKIYNYNQEQARTIALFTSKYNGQRVEQNFEKVTTIAKDISAQCETMVKENNQSRELVMSTMKNTLNTHEDIFGIAITYEPNKFDHMDNEYINAAGSDSNGQFMPYITRNNKNDFSTELCFYNHYTKKQTKWYDTPKKTHNVFLTEPTTYTVQGKAVTMASVVVPIIRDDEFVGVVSIDTSLEYLQHEIKKERPLGGFTEIVSSNGICVANGEDSSKIMTDLSKEQEWKSLLKEVTKGDTFIKSGTSSVTKENVLQVFNPIRITDTNQYWTCVSIIPINNIFKDFSNYFRLISIVGILLFIFIVYINYSIITKDL